MSLGAPLTLLTSLDQYYALVDAALDPLRH